MHWCYRTPNGGGTCTSTGFPATNNCIWLVAWCFLITAGDIVLPLGFYSIPFCSCERVSTPCLNRDLVIGKHPTLTGFWPATFWVSTLVTWGKNLKTVLSCRHASILFFPNRYLCSCRRHPNCGSSTFPPGELHGESPGWTEAESPLDRRERDTLCDRTGFWTKIMGPSDHMSWWNCSFSSPNLGSWVGLCLCRW